MNQALILSHKHHLLPVAHRLRSEGVDTEVIYWRRDKPGRKNRFDHAWSGLMERTMPCHEVTPEWVEHAADLAADGKMVVLAEPPSAVGAFSGAARLLPRLEPESPPRSNFRLGGWWDGERLVSPHALFCDATTWPGGLGPGPEGAMALVRLDPALEEIFDQLVEPSYEWISSNENFVGLVQLGLFLDTADGIPRVEGGELGWPWLHTHAFLSECENFSRVVCEGDVPNLSSKFVVVIPVTMPPWPWPDGKADESLIEGLTAQRQGEVFWHDVQVKDGALWTCGLDGLVGVTRGAAQTPELARSRALDLAQAIQIPHKQYRPDAVAGLSLALAGMEQAFGIVL